MKKLLLLTILMPTISNAGMFLDLAVGTLTHTNFKGSNPTQDCNSTIKNCLADNNVLGRFRFGYKHMWNKHVGNSIYFEHTSAMSTNNESGINGAFLELNLEL